MLWSDAQGPEVFEVVIRCGGIWSFAFPLMQCAEELVERRWPALLLTMGGP